MVIALDIVEKIKELGIEPSWQPGTNTIETPNFTIELDSQGQRYRYYPTNHKIIGKMAADWHDIVGGNHPLDVYLNMQKRAADMPKWREELKQQGLAKLPDKWQESCLPSFKHFFIEAADGYSNKKVKGVAKRAAKRAAEVDQNRNRKLLNISDKEGKDAIDTVKRVYRGGSDKGK